MLHYEIQGDSLIIYIKDELDHHAVTYLRETSDRLIEAGNVKNIVFDFKDVSFEEYVRSYYMSDRYINE